MKEIFFWHIKSQEGWNLYIFLSGLIRMVLAVLLIICNLNICHLSYEKKQPTKFRSFNPTPSCCLEFFSVSVYSMSNKIHIYNCFQNSSRYYLFPKYVSRINIICRIILFLQETLCFFNFLKKYYIISTLLEKYAFRNNFFSNLMST